MQTIKALGRTFDTSSNGLLLDLDGNETRFKTAELEIKMDGRHEIDLFSDAQDGYYTAHTDKFLIQPAIEDAKDGFNTFLLMRNGRMVRFIETGRSSIMYD